MPTARESPALAASAAPPPVAASTRSAQPRVSSIARLRYLRELVVHLAARELTSRHRFTLLGWTWPLLRQLVQVAVLVFVFTKVFEAPTKHFAVFVFIGLIAWSWFASSISLATSSIVGQRHLVFQPRFPTSVLPVVAIVVALVDVLMALPVLGLMLLVGGHVEATVALLPALLALQGLMLCGIGWMTAAAAVYLRDMQNLVLVALLTLFYLTPVFYDLEQVPDDYATLLRLNPMSPVIEGYRSVLLWGELPSWAALGQVALASALLAGLGLAFFRHVQRGFVDEL